MTSESKLGSYFHFPALTFFATLQQRVLEFLKLRVAIKWGRARTIEQCLSLANWLESQSPNIVQHWPKELEIVDQENPALNSYDSENPDGNQESYDSAMDPDIVDPGTYVGQGSISHPDLHDSRV